MTMQIVKFQAPTIQEAMAQAQAELGADAVLLYQRAVEQKGPLGVGRRSGVEITVAVDRPPPLSASDLPQPDLPRPEAARPSHGWPPAAHAAPAVQPPARLTPAAVRLSAEGAAASNGYETLRRELQLIRQLLYRQNVSQSRLPEPLWGWHSALLEQALPAPLVDELLGTMGEMLTAPALQRPELVAAALERRMLADMQDPLGSLPQGRPGEPLVFVLVGPTGVGKTTTIAKLAAHYSLEKRLPIALITTDTFRIGAVAQLRTYSDLMQVPLEVAYTASDLTALVERHRDRALILVDTPGRSPGDTEQLASLRSFVRALPNPHLQIAVAATSHLADARRIVQNFSVAPPAGLLVTKLDEATLLGPIYALVTETRLPLTYFTTGQRVPEDIEIASNEGMVGHLLRVASGCWRDDRPRTMDDGGPSSIVHRLPSPIWA